MSSLVDIDRLINDRHSDREVIVLRARCVCVTSAAFETS